MRRPQWSWAAGDDCCKPARVSNCTQQRSAHAGGSWHMEGRQGDSKRGRFGSQDRSMGTPVPVQQGTLSAAGTHMQADEGCVPQEVTAFPKNITCKEWLHRAGVHHRR